MRIRMSYHRKVPLRALKDQSQRSPLLHMKIARMVQLVAAYQLRQLLVPRLWRQGTRCHSILWCRILYVVRHINLQLNRWALLKLLALLMSEWMRSSFQCMCATAVFVSLILISCSRLCQLTDSRTHQWAMFMAESWSLQLCPVSGYGIFILVCFQ